MNTSKANEKPFIETFSLICALFASYFFVLGYFSTNYYRDLIGFSHVPISSSYEYSYNAYDLAIVIFSIISRNILPIVFLTGIICLLHVIIFNFFNNNIKNEQQAYCVKKMFFISIIFINLLFLFCLGIREKALIYSFMRQLVKYPSNLIQLPTNEASDFSKLMNKEGFENYILTSLYILILYASFISFVKILCKSKPVRMVFHFSFLILACWMSYYCAVFYGPTNVFFNFKYSSLNGHQINNSNRSSTRIILSDNSDTIYIYDCTFKKILLVDKTEIIDKQLRGMTLSECANVNKLISTLKGK